MAGGSLGPDALVLPTGTTDQRPTGSAGHFRFNTSLNQPEYGNNANGWVPLSTPGFSQGNPAESASYLYDNGFVTSGKGLYWIDTPNGGAKQVYCDFDTQDENGDSGWMLVATFATDYEWTFGGNTTSGTIDSFSGRQISSNFGDYSCKMFRITANSAVGATHGSSASADWYYYRSTALDWKRWWSYSDTQYYEGNNYGGYSGTPLLLNDSGSAHTRLRLKPFTHARNIKYSYTTTQQTNQSLADTTHANGNYNPTVAFHTALTTAGNNFNIHYTQYADGSQTNDGTLGILPQGYTGPANATGQDINACQSKVGYDDQQAIAVYGSSATQNFNSQNPGTGNSTSLMWWIK